LQTGGGAVIETLFHTVKGEPIAQNSISNVYKRILLRAGLRDFRGHDARQIYASYC
jgi:integrase